MWRARGSPPHHLGSPLSHPGSIPAPSTLGLRGVPTIPAPVQGPGSGFAGERRDARRSVPYRVHCFAWRPERRFPRAVRTRRGRAFPSRRYREAFSTWHLGLSQVATAQGRHGETLSPGGGPRG